MNPEFVRNVWLELTPRRVAFTLCLLALVMAALVTANQNVPEAAEAAYYVFTVLWGTHSAALAVVGEIRNRTWDLQRLSSIEPLAMTWGKLFGSTIYNWFAGGICLAIMAATRLAGADGTVYAHALLVAVSAQAASFLASLLAAARRQQHTRLEVYLYQMVGLLTAAIVWWLLQMADPESIARGRAPVFVRWWGLWVRTSDFVLASVVVFTAWILAACYRTMRIELRMQNGPWVWVGWLVFIGIYEAGFDPVPKLAASTEVARRLSLALATYTGFTYAMVLLEPKERVLYRWLGAELRGGRIASALAHLQAWMISYAASLLVGGMLILWLAAGGGREPAAPLEIVTGLGFFTRDVAIFLLMQTLQRRRGDLAAVAALWALYLLVPTILRGLGLGQLLPIVYPMPGTGLLGVLAPWVQAAVVVTAAARRVASGRRSVPVAAYSS